MSIRARQNICQLEERQDREMEDAVEWANGTLTKEGERREEERMRPASLEEPDHWKGWKGRRETTKKEEKKSQPGERTGWTELATALLNGEADQDCLQRTEQRKEGETDSVGREEGVFATIHWSLFPFHRSNEKETEDERTRTAFHYINEAYPRQKKRGHLDDDQRGGRLQPQRTRRRSNYRNSKDRGGGTESPHYWRSTKRREERNKRERRQGTEDEAS
jgi:hypothetical protein